ncbi:EEF1A lysine methyltransferase 2 isoform X1 [Halyomorpha halys]|uniref:EEF1A lysine methyltransferase 2 isoform X1 n=1 Tax=Halyomorpha halys TaxID=286706 RepID=UPI0006D518AD|nr:EEF1A lysine methyltransferase 2 isoform X1 [Halyomorpha halys]
MESNVDDNGDLVPSELGTKEYWSTVYVNEKNNFKNYGDPGEIWFGEESEERILRWLEKKKISKNKKIVDLGCGNGMMLVSLCRSGFTNLTGIDYCSEAVELSKSVAFSHDIHNIKFKVLDLVGNLDISDFDIAFDKGTYDAISLNPDNAVEKRQKYIENVSNLLNDDGLFIITTCNWTDQEILLHCQDVFQCFEIIPTPTFHFGGKTGNVVSTLVLQKNK